MKFIQEWQSYADKMEEENRNKMGLIYARVFKLRILKEGKQYVKAKKMLFGWLLLEAPDSWTWFWKAWRQFTAGTESRQLCMREDDGILQHTRG